jgi:hypothetical protein
LEIQHFSISQNIQKDDQEKNKKKSYKETKRKFKRRGAIPRDAIAPGCERRGETNAPSLPAVAKARNGKAPPITS